MTANKKGMPLECADRTGTPENQGQNTTSTTSLQSGLIPAQELFWERECRTMEAEAMLSLVSRIISEDAERDGKMLSQLQRYGLCYVCDIVLKNIQESLDALCDCHEKGLQKEVNQ